MDLTSGYLEKAKRTGINAIDEMGNLVGFGQKWGLLGDADEDEGIVPGPEWMKQNEKWLSKTYKPIRWSDAQTANTSIGQGFVLVTPLQLTTFYSAVANGGTVYRHVCMIASLQREDKSIKTIGLKR